MIDEMLIATADLPSWVISGIIGAVLGAVGGFLGTLIGRKTGFSQAPLILAVACAAASVPLARTFLLPAMVEAKMNENLPAQVDEVTTMLRARYSGERFAYHYQLADTVDDDLDAKDLKASLLTQLCNHWRPQFASGEIEGADYQYQLHGRLISFSVEPVDCPQS